MKALPFFPAALVGLLVAGCGRSADSPVFRLDGKANNVATGAESRRNVAITVYNDGFGLIRELRAAKMPEGRVDLAMRDVTTHIDARTVSLRSLSNPGFIQVLEQSYRYDLLGPASLLEKYVGKKIRVYRKDGAGEMGETAVDAEVLSTEGGTLFRLDGEVTTKPRGRLAFPGIPDGLVAKPTLVVSLGNALRDREHLLELTYMSSGFSWKSDYVLSLDDKDESVDVKGWVTLENHTGASFDEAELRLVAGDVHKLLERVTLDEINYREDETVSLLGGAKDAEPSFKEERLFEFHLYALQRRTNLLDNEQKQISLLESHNTKVRKTLTFEAPAGGTAAGTSRTTNAQIRIEIDNKKENGLGIPLPKGHIRLFKKDTSPERASHLIGEDSIEHTPEGEPIKLVLGSAFDLVGQRKHLTHKVLSECITDDSYSIEIRNHRSSDAVVEILEPIADDWTITSHSLGFVKKDAHSIVFSPTVPKDGVVVVTYAVRAKTC